MLARDPYALTQVPSPLIQPGRYRFGRHKTVVSGEEDGAQVFGDAPDPTWVGGASAQDAPDPGARVDSSAFRGPRPVMNATQVEHQRKKRRGCLVSAIVVVATLAIMAMGSCTACMDAVFDDFGGSSDDYDSRGSYEYDYGAGYEYLDDFDSSAYDISVFDELYGDGVDAGVDTGSDDSSSTRDDVRAATDSVYKALEGIESSLSGMN